MTIDDARARPIALVTGASKGIGEAFALTLAQEGYRLALVAPERADLEHVAAKIEDMSGAPAHTIGMDMSKAGAAKRLLGDLGSQDLLPDLLVNNAGFGLMGEAVALDVDAQVDMINLNITALTELSILCAKLMAKRGSGGIINVSSVAGTLPGPKMAVYYASKAYILSFTQALATELKGAGVKVTAVAPGVTRTAFHQRAGMERSLLLKWSAPMSPEAVARIGYDGFLRGRNVVATGVFNKFAMMCTLFVPNSLLNLVTARLHSPGGAVSHYAENLAGTGKTDR